MYCAHLVCDGADTADPGCDVRRLQAGTAAKESLEESRRFEDLQFHVGNAAVSDANEHRTFAFNACEIVHVDGPCSHMNFSCRSLSARNAGASELKFLKDRTISSWAAPSFRNQSARDSVFGFSFGPKHP